MWFQHALSLYLNFMKFKYKVIYSANSYRIIMNIKICNDTHISTNIPISRILTPSPTPTPPNPIPTPYPHYPQLCATDPVYTVDLLNHVKAGLSFIESSYGADNFKGVINDIDPDVWMQLNQQFSSPGHIWDRRASTANSCVVLTGFRQWFKLWFDWFDGNLKRGLLILTSI